MNAHGEIFNEDESVNGARLIADLRAYRVETSYGPGIPMLTAIAADHIAALESRNAELEAKLAQIEEDAYSRGFDTAIAYAENLLKNMQPGDDDFDTLDRATKAVASIIDPRRLMKMVPE